MVRPDERPRYAVMAGAVCALAASGTVTAELALLRIPTVVCYCLPRLESTLARLLVRTRYFALPNIIAGSAVVTELLNPDANVLQSALRLLLVSSSARERVRAGLGAVARRLGPEGGMKRVARLVLDRACGSSRTPPGGQAA
jgi:lipid-A-disaccharide synthase